MDLFTSPLFARLERAEHVLIAGAGGGFDVYSGLPLYFRLRAMGKRVSLANLSFTWFSRVQGRAVTPDCLEVTAATQGPEHYFPEGVLCRWFRARGEAVSVYTFDNVGVVPLREAYAALHAELGFDTVVLVDGGTDLLMRGDEAGLGTPVQDISSLAAVDALTLRDKLVVCLGFGVDAYHGVCHAHFLEAVATLSRSGAYLGVTALLKGMPEVDLYREAVMFSAEAMAQRPSIVSLSVVGALDGDYGDQHRTSRTQGSQLWINPLMSLYWAFDLDAVARRCLYLEQLKDTKTTHEVSALIEAFREEHPSKPWEKIPV